MCVDFTDVCSVVSHAAVFISLEVPDAQHGAKVLISVILNVIMTAKRGDATVPLTGSV